MITIYKVGEYDGTVRCGSNSIQRGVEQCWIAARLDLLGNALVGKDIGDLANTDDLAATIGQFIEQGWGWRKDGQIPAIAGSDEFGIAFAYKWPGNESISRIIALVILLCYRNTNLL